MPDVLNVHEAKTHFSSLLRRVEAGEEVVIARSGTPVARLVPLKEAAPRRRPLDTWRGKVWMADDFDAPLPDALLDAFEGTGDESLE